MVVMVEFVIVMILAQIIHTVSANARWREEEDTFSARVGTKCDGNFAVVMMPNDDLRASVESNGNRHCRERRKPS